MGLSGPAPPRRLARRRATLGAALSASVAAIGLLAVYRWLWPGPGEFVAALDHGTRLFGDFHDVYLPMARAVWTPPVEPVPNFLYSAFFALLLAPLGPLPTGAAVWLWGAVQAAALLALWSVPFRALLRGGPAAAAGYGLLLLLSQPVFHNLAWGQVSVLMVAGMLAATAALATGRSATAGLLLAAAASIKYYPALLLVLFLARRDRRALAAFGLGIVAFLGVAPMAFLGPAGWLSFQRHAQGALLRAGWVQGDVNSQYLVHVVLRWLGGADQTPHAGETAATALMLAGWAVAAGCMWTAWHLQSRPARRDTALAAVALLLSLPFLLRTSWPHYFVSLPFCQALILIRIAGRGRAAGRLALAVPVALSIALGSVPALLASGHWSVYSRRGWLLVADALLLIPLAILALRAGKGRLPVEAGAAASAPARG